MKLLIVICVVVLLLQLAAVGRNMSSSDGAPPSKEAVENGDWDPAVAVPVGAKLEALVDRFRPRLELPWEDDTHAFPAGANEPVTFEGGADQRVAKFELTAGTGVRIGYGCDSGGEECEQDVCLCAANAPLELRHFLICGDGFRPEGGRCPADGNLGKIVVREETGVLWFTGLGELGGTVRQR
ncbi:MAG TPA: hypothetical protein VF339_11005 [Gammaproteobacteria bacterium]